MEFLDSQFSVIRGIKGFKRVYEDALKYQYMITKKALEKVRILIFWEKHGLRTTLEAFPQVKRRTLFAWKKQWQEGGKKPEALNEKRRTPKTKRVRTWPQPIIEAIKELREAHPNLGKEKLYPLLLTFCAARHLSCPKSSTIGRILSDLGGLRRFPRKISHFGKVRPVKRKKVLRKPKGLVAAYPGHVVSFDTFEEHDNGRRRYVLTATDVHTRISLAWATHSHASLAAKEFFDRVKLVFPFPFTTILTDNGSEFAKHFGAEIQKLHLLHYHTYPRTPKMNAHTERFNRTVQEEFSNFQKALLFNDMDMFNHKLLEYLLWYNTERVHWAFGNKRSPVQFLAETVASNPHLSQECKDGWTYTSCECKNLFSPLEKQKEHGSVRVLTANTKTMLSLQLHHIVDLYCLVEETLPKQTPSPHGGRPPLLSNSELVTILIWNTLALRHQTLRDLYQTLVLYHQKDFPRLPKYRGFVDHCHRSLPLLVILLQTLLSRTDPVRIVDATMLPVCTLPRADSHRVAKTKAEFGKNHQGWHYGFKLHASIDLTGKLCGIYFTGASTHDAQALPKILNQHTKIAVGDTLYGARVMGRHIYETYGTIIIAPPHPKQTKKLMTKWQHWLLRIRTKIESVFDYLKEHLHLVSSFPRSVNGYLLHYVRILLGYQVMALLRGE